METTFFNQYLIAPPAVREFIYSEEYYQLLEEYLKKFEIKEDLQQTEFVYLLQDLIFKVFTPANVVELKNELRTKLNLNEDLANQLAYILFNRLIPKINNLWKKETKTERIEPQISELIKKIKEVKEKTKKPTRILNLQKIIPLKKEKGQQETVNIKKTSEISQPKVIKIEVPTIKTENIKPTEEKLPTIEEVNINIPSTKTENLVSTTETEKQEEIKKDESQTAKVIIKRQKPQKNEGDVIDLSSY